MMNVMKAEECIAQTCDECTFDNECGWCSFDSSCSFGTLGGSASLTSPCYSKTNNTQWFFTTCPSNYSLIRK